MEGSYDRGNLPLGSMKHGEFLDYSSDYQLLHEGSQSRQTVNRVVSPVGLETKNHCAGEGQQQFTGQ
jgi:hypothetical protein